MENNEEEMKLIGFLRYVWIGLYSCDFVIFRGVTLTTKRMNYLNEAKREKGLKYPKKKKK